MLEALHKDLVKKVYDKASGYYDWLHHVGTFNLDQKGRKYLVNRIVKNGDLILDAGGGTGTTSILALKESGGQAKSVVLDFSENMLEKAKEKARKNNFEDRITLKVGDMYDIPFPDNYFDVVISTYSTCPLDDPLKAVKEMLRVLKPNGLMGIAHSSQAENGMARKLGNWMERVIWKFPRLSMGCRNIDLLTGINKMNVEIIENKLIGFIPWFFRILVLRKVEN
ncbi:MAG: class I SAM-dependent methyltransferase [Cyclobacteriaceae bacterium]|nr:class I SAM-dependent methyltransferase [Cyclobacteriaceae bacterium]